MKINGIQILNEIYCCGLSICQAWDGSGIRTILRYPDPDLYPMDP